jgi:hypothetical protein
VVPRWSSLARSGAPKAGELWPFDPELAQLRAGLRRVIKRETAGGEELERARAWLAESALTVVVEGAVLLAGVEPQAVERAHGAHRAGDRAPDAVRELGALLGYPTCCVERYLALDVRSDAALFSALLPPETERAPPESLWLVGALSLVSHAPCALGCQRTLALGGATLEELERGHPGWSARWRALAARRHVIDADGRVFCAGEDVSEVIATAVPRLAPASTEMVGRVVWTADHRGTC